VKRIRVFGMFLVLSALALGVQAQTEKDTDPDRTFIETALIGNMYEIESGKIAAQTAANPEVKSFGQKMVEDHGKAQDELKQIAQAKGIPVPTSLDKKNKDKLDEVSKEQGEDFDKAYMKMMVKDHKKDISDYQEEADKGKDPEIKSYAAETVGILKGHLKMAQEINGKLK
jgi:putative membrane protein